MEIIKMMAELTLANEKFKERTAKMSSNHPEYRQPAPTNEHIPLLLYDGKHNFLELMTQFKAIFKLRQLVRRPKNYIPAGQNGGGSLCGTWRVPQPSCLPEPRKGQSPSLNLVML